MIKNENGKRNTLREREEERVRKREKRRKSIA